jgi:hypothetical protein
MSDDSVPDLTLDEFLLAEREERDRKVAQGAALLDAEVPGWAQRIDLPSLSMRDGSHCVLGQLFGDYFNGTSTLGIKYQWQQKVSHGFTIDLPARLGRTMDRDIDREFRLLTSAWKSLIGQRLATDLPQKG